MASHSMGLSLHDAARQVGVPFTVENEPLDRHVKVNGLNLHYLEWGDPGAPTIMMLHGIQQQAHSWDFISLPLSVDYRVIAVDQRGHGDSDWSTDEDYSTDSYVGDVEALVSALGLKGFSPDRPFHGRPQQPGLGVGATRNVEVIDHRRHRAGDATSWLKPDPAVPRTSRRVGYPGRVCPAGHGIHRPYPGTDAGRFEVQHQAARRREVDVEV